MTDKELEELWEELEDIPVYMNEDYEMVLEVDWKIWRRGTSIERIWDWFDRMHSKGIYWLMYRR